VAVGKGKHVDLGSDKRGAKMETKKYNGWTNYETWVTALWVDNEEWSYIQRQELAQEVWDGIKGLADDHDDAKDRHVRDYSEAIKQWIDADFMPELGASLASDLLTAAFSDVNWYEIAENWLDEFDYDTDKEVA